MLCFAAPLSLIASHVHGGEVQTQPEYKAPLDHKVAMLEPTNSKDSESQSWHYSFMDRFKKRESVFHPIIIEVSKHHEVDPALVKAIILAESEYNPNAISRKGAKGLMQLMPRTAQALGVKHIFDPEQNINGGVKYFKKLLNKFDGDITLALAAYNSGSKHVLIYRGIPPFKATKRYVRKV